MDYGLDEYDLLDDQPTPFARWVLPALIISILLHVLLFVWVGRMHLPLFANDPSAAAPPIFKLKAVVLDPKILEPSAAEKKQAAAAPQAVQLPKDKPSLSAMMAENRGLPSAPKIDDPLLAEKPKVEATSYSKTLQDAENSGVKSVSKELDQVRSELLSEKPDVAGRPLLDLDKTAPDSGGSPSTKGAAAGADQPGFSDLDKLLAQTGPLADETTIRMDSDVLYEFDSFQLQPQAAESLQKLGQIMQKNPQFDFTIEGHSDSFGTEEYDQRLSEQRAESVKAWLVQYMGIDPAIIQTRGYGKSRLKIPPTGAPTEENIKAEQINRRVEIVMHDRAQTP